MHSTAAALTAPPPDRQDSAHRFTASARARGGVVPSLDHFHDWYAERHTAHRFAVTPIPFARLAGWSFQTGTGNLGHDSGRFFTIEGLQVHTDREGPGTWRQPIIEQPEIGLLGILVKEFDGVLHCLMQAKMEPGNINTLQLSPTVQATRSNYTGVHKGAGIRYIEHFVPPRRQTVLADGLHSEQGSWFLAKRNRNIVVETTEEIEVHEDYCWLTIGQIHQLLKIPNLVNMDSRTVLSLIPFAAPGVGDERAPAGEFTSALIRSLAGTASRHSLFSLLSDLTEQRSRHELRRRLIPLDETAADGWHRTEHEIARDDGQHFRVIAVDVRAPTREVGSWSQPILAPAGRGIAAFVVKAIDGVLHVLLHARVEAGSHTVCEFAPTVQCQPDAHHAGAAGPLLGYLKEVLAAPRGRIRYDVVHSEEGGRFYHAENRYLVVEADDGFPDGEPDGYRWATVEQLTLLLRHGGTLNVEARTLVACLHTLW